MPSGIAALHEEVDALEQSHYFLKARYILVWDGEKHCQLENGYLEVNRDKIIAFHRTVPTRTPYEDLGNVANRAGIHQSTLPSVGGIRRQEL